MMQFQTGTQEIKRSVSCLSFRTVREKLRERRNTIDWTSHLEFGFQNIHFAMFVNDKLKENEER